MIRTSRIVGGKECPHSVEVNSMYLNAQRAFTYYLVGTKVYRFLKITIRNQDMRKYKLN